MRLTPLKNRIVSRGMVFLLLLLIPWGALAKLHGKKIIMIIPSKGFLG
jgi:hypothetical protein